MKVCHNLPALLVAKECVFKKQVPFIWIVFTFINPADVFIQREDGQTSIQVPPVRSGAKCTYLLFISDRGEAEISIASMHFKWVRSDHWKSASGLLGIKLHLSYFSDFKYCVSKSLKMFIMALLYETHFFSLLVVLMVYNMAVKTHS